MIQGPYDPRVTVARAELPKGRRVLILSDIHGHHQALQKLLRRLSFSAEDTLVVAGDLLEKGKESLPVIRTLMTLSGQGRVFVLPGNMDVYTLSKLLSDDPKERRELFEIAPRMVEWWGGCLLMEMCAELGLPFSPDMDDAEAQRAILSHFEKELDFLTRLPVILDTPRMTFVHGGLPHLRLDELTGRDSFSLLKCDNFLSRGLSFPKYVTVGHWPVVLYRDRYMDMSPMLIRDRKILCLDGGCGVKKSGQLNCVLWEDPASDCFSFTWEDELPRATALTAQAPSEDFTYIKFHDRKVQDIQPDGPDFVRVRWHGRSVRVPQLAVDTQTPGQLNTDYTDYRLPVQRGDHLSVIRSFGQDHYVRRDGVLGWYSGALGEADPTYAPPLKPVPCE